MSEQNSYKISYDYGYGFWHTIGVFTANSWQEALDSSISYSSRKYSGSWIVPHTVISETPSEDGRSGIIKIKVGTDDTPWTVKVTLVEDN